MPSIGETETFGVGGWFHHPARFEKNRRDGDANGNWEADYVRLMFLATKPNVATLHCVREGRAKNGASLNFTLDRGPDVGESVYYVQRRRH